MGGASVISGISTIDSNSIDKLIEALEGIKIDVLVNNTSFFFGTELLSAGVLSSDAKVAITNQEAAKSVQVEELEQFQSAGVSVADITESKEVRDLVMQIVEMN